MIDSMEIIESCDLEFGSYSKLNEYYTRPRYQLSV